MQEHGKCMNKCMILKISMKQCPAQLSSIFHFVYQHVVRAWNKFEMKTIKGDLDLYFKMRCFIVS